MKRGMRKNIDIEEIMNNFIFPINTVTFDSKIITNRLKIYKPTWMNIHNLSSLLQYIKTYKVIDFSYFNFY